MVLRRWSRVLHPLDIDPPQDAESVHPDDKYQSEATIRTEISTL